MLPYGLLADLHLHPWSSFSSVNEDGVNTRLVGLLNEITRAAKEVSEAGGNTVIFAGDVFHVRGSVSPTVLNATRDALRFAAVSYSVHFLIMPGNHDLEGKESTRLSSAVTALESEHCTVTSQTHFSGSDVILVPWYESIHSLKAEIERIKGAITFEPIGNFDLILHAPIDGVIKGLPFHGLSPEYLAGLGFNRVFAGHYHNHKRFTGEVYSIGALAHHTWSDVGSKAGFCIVHPDRVEWRKSHLPEFIDLSQLVDLDPSDIPLIVDSNYVRVKVSSTTLKDVEKARVELLAMGAKAVIVQPEPKPPAREGTEFRPTVASGASLEVSVKDYVASLCAAEQRELVTVAAMKILSDVDSLGE